MTRERYPAETGGQQEIDEWRRTLLKLAAIGGGANLAGLSTGSALAASEFVDVLSVDPSNYPEILLNIRVDTEAGRNGELTEEDFRIIENDVEQAVESFSFASTSADVIFVFDDTGSMGDEISAMKSGVKGLTDDIETTGIDARYGLVSFKDSVETDLGFTDDADALKSAVDGLSAEGGGDGPEDNFDAIETALDFGFRSDAQKIIVDITDNVSHYDGDGSGFSEYTLDEVATDLTESGVAYIAVAPDRDEPNASKKTLANEVGGLWIDIRSADFSVILDEITEVVVTAYVVEYITDAAPGASRSVGVEVTDPEEGTDSDTGDLEIPEDVSTTIETAKENKLAITSEVDRLAATIDEQSRVTPTLNGLQSAINTGTVQELTAVEAVERMILVEDIAELSLAGLSAREAETGEDPDSLAGESKGSVGADPSMNVLGTTGGFVIEGVLSLTSLVSTVNEYVVKLGTSHPVAGKLLDLAGKAADIIDEILGYLGTARSLMTALIDGIWQDEIKNNLLDGEYDSSDKLLNDILGEIDGLEEKVSDHMMSGYESGKDRDNALDDTLKRVDSELSVEDGGPMFGGGTANDGPIEDASAAADSARAEISALITETQEKLDNNEWIAILLNIIELAIVLGAAAAAPTVGVSGVVAGAIGLIFGLPALVLVLIGIKRGLDAGQEALNICDKAARAIVDGNPEVSL